MVQKSNACINSNRNFIHSDFLKISIVVGEVLNLLTSIIFEIEILTTLSKV